MTPKEFVRNTAVNSFNQGRNIDGATLAQMLNNAGLKTSYGTPYAGGRGTYTLVHATYDWLLHRGLGNEADMVADVYINQYGNYAYDK